MSEPMRVLHVLGGLGLGGAETFVMNLYRTIDRNEVQFDFVIYQDGLRNYEEEIKALGGRIFLSPHFNAKTAIQYRVWWKNFLKEHPEYKIIHGHLRSTAVIYLREAKKQGRYVIAHSHSTSSGTGLSALAKNILQFPIRYVADSFLGCCKEANEWLFGKKVANSLVCQIIRNAIPLEKFSFSPQNRENIRRELQIADDEFVIGNIGRFVPPKNQKFLIEIFYQFLTINPNSKLVLVGTGPLENDLREKVKSLKIEKKVIFLKDRRDIEKILSGLDVFLLPSLYEGLSVAAVEAQANSLLMICSDTVSREVVIGNKIFFKQLDEAPEAWAKFMAETALKYKREETIFNENFEEYAIDTTTDVIKSIYVKALQSQM